jgi:hypothetical protein
MRRLGQLFARRLYLALGFDTRNTSRNVLAYTQKVQALNPIAYWPQADASGGVATDASGNGFNGAYSNVTLGVPGIGDNRTAAAFNGTSSYTNVLGAGFTGAFNGAEGTLSAWMQITSAAVWSDGITRQIFIALVDGNNYVQISKASSVNNLFFEYKAGGTAKNVAVSAGPATTWLHVAITWSKSGDAVKVYLSGTQIGGTQTGLGTFAGSLTRAIIGAVTTTPGQVWDGNLAHAAIWTRALTASEIATLATV